MPTEREAVRKFLRSGHPAAEWLMQGVAEGRISSSDDVVGTDEELLVLAGDDRTIIGARQARCGCGAVVWISPSTQEMMAKRGDRPTTVICMRCAMAAAKRIADDDHRTQ